MTDQPIKFVELVFKRPDLTDERFHYHWRTVHGPIAARLTQMRRYVQLHRVLPWIPGLPAVACEGVVESWFDTLGDVEAIFADPAYLEGAKLDEPLFLDEARLDGYMTEEAVSQLHSDQPGVKAVVMLRSRPDSDASAFKQRTRVWAEQLANATRVEDWGVSYVHQAEYGGGAPTFDAFVVLTFADLDQFESSWAEPPVVSTLRNIHTFADYPRCAGFVGEEHRVIWNHPVGVK